MQILRLSKRIALKTFVGIFLFISFLAFSADRTVTVRPADGDYTTLQGAILGEVAANADLTSDNGSGSAGILHFKIEGDWSGGADTTAVVVNGFTDSADYYPHIYTDSANRAEAASWNTSKYILAVTDLSCLVITDNYVRVDGLQVNIIYSSSANRWGIYAGSLAAGNDIRISSNRVRGTVNAAANGRGIGTDGSNAIIKIWNNIVYECDSRGIFIDAGTTVDIFNNTVYLIPNNAIETDVTATIKNNLSFRNADDFQDDAGDSTISFNASDNDDDSGADNVDGNEIDADWTTDIAGAATGNFELLLGTPLIGAAAVDPGGGLYSDDIDGTARGVAWDVSAHEFVSGEPPAEKDVIVPIIMQQLNQFNGGTMLAISLVVNMAFIVVLVLMFRRLRRVRPFKDIEEMEAYCEVERLLEGQWEGR